MGKNKITTVQAALVMIMVFNIDGVDRVGWAYLGQAIQMSQDLGIFKAHRAKSMSMQIVREMTAWAVFA